MSIKKGYRYVAYDAANGEYKEFKTKKDAKKWLTEIDGDGISPEAEDGLNWIAEIKFKSVVTPLEFKSDYHIHTDECTCDCDEEEWPYNDDFDYIATHEYELIDWEKDINKEE